MMSLLNSASCKSAFYLVAHIRAYQTTSSFFCQPDGISHSGSLGIVKDHTYCSPHRGPLQVISQPFHHPLLGLSLSSKLHSILSLPRSPLYIAAIPLLFQALFETYATWSNCLPPLSIIHTTVKPLQTWELSMCQ